MLPRAFNLPEDDDRDFRPIAAALAKGFNTLRTFPDQQLNADLQNVMQQQTARKGRNKTIELLKSFGTPDMDRLAAMVQSGGLGAKDAYSLMFSMEAEQRAADRAKSAADLKYSRDLKLAELRTGKGTTRYKNAIQAGLIPDTPEFKRFMLTGKIDNSFEAEYRKTLAKPPAGQDYEFKYDDLGQFQGVKLVNIEGGKQEKELSDEAQARFARVANQSRSGRIVLENIDRAIEIAMGTKMATGLRGQLLQNIGGTEARNLLKTIETVSATIGFDRLQRMRDESPTGGALGQVAVQELEALRATMGSLDITQDREIVVGNLQRVKREYITSMKRIIDAAIIDNEKGLINKNTGKVVSPYDFFSEAEVNMILSNDVETGEEGQASNVTVIDGYTIELSE